MERISIFGLGTAALFSLLPFAVSTRLFYGSVNAKAFLFIAFVLALISSAAVMFWQGKRRVSFGDRPFLWAGMLLLGVYWFSALLGVYTEASLFSDIERSTGVFFLTHVATLSFILGEFATDRDWMLIRRAVAISTGIFALGTMVGIEGLGLTARFAGVNLGVSGLTLGNSTFAGAYMLLALIVALVELTHLKARTVMRAVVGVSAALIIFSPILFDVGALVNFSLPLGSARASSASAWLLLCFGGGYLLLKRLVESRNTLLLWRWWCVSWVTMLVLGLTLLFTPGSVVQQRYVEASTGARLIVWSSGIKAFVDRPLLGWGPENYEQAMQRYFDNRLYQDEFIGEVWFDRAHNVFIDTLVNVGALGMLVMLIVSGLFVRVVGQAYKRQEVSEAEMVWLVALPFAHVLQLQTGFDTVGSYALLGVFGGYGLHLEKRKHKREIRVGERNAIAYRSGAALLIALVVISAYATHMEYARQAALYRVFVSTDNAARLQYIEKATERTSSFESLRLSSLSLAKGVLQSVAQKKATQKDLESALEQMSLYEAQYQQYLTAQPDYYRARMALGYLMSVEFALGGAVSLEEAKQVVAKGYNLSPGNLLTPAIEALLELYSGNLDIARTRAEEVVRLNPNVIFGQKVQEHVERQVRTFPSVSVLQLENL